MAAGQSTFSTNKLAVPGAGGSKRASKQGFFPGSTLSNTSNALMQANTALGRLPTLGLNQIKLEEF